MSSTTPLAVLGFDFGRKRIGVAVGQAITHTASPLTTITVVADRPDWTRITQLIEQWQPQALVLGLPLNNDGSDSEITSRVRRFGNQLQGRYNLPLHLIDERLSSHAAESLLQEQGKAYDKAQIDAYAAKLIVESWLHKEQNK